jgi:RNA polymerase sigma-70 factor (ECF subfamily)
MGRMPAHQQRQGASLEAIERVYRARLPEFRRVATAIGGDPELARDAVQDAFALAVRKRASFRGRGPLEAWLWRIVVNATLSRCREASPTTSLPNEPQPCANGQPEAAAERVRSALILLGERQRLVLFLHYYADLDYAAIAEVLEISPGTVGATLTAARAAMRRLLEEVVL